ncbi:putative NADH-dependent oxidoreductase [Scheffersomyces coipomensis]|uniref:putative NADH-dependent oxidoreductase n=1 Tax=Scheffersomyces coipomensis TaxID=1788519 RepID=UPI00315C71FF
MKRSLITATRAFSKQSIRWNQHHHTIISEKFKSSMGGVSSQAMILTSAFENSNYELHGMTLSSVSSLAVYPNPLLEFNLHLPSYTSRALHNLKYLAIHLLPPTSKSVHLCRIFASGVKRDKTGTELASTNEENEDGEVFHEMTTPFSKISKHEDYTFYKINDEISIPILNDSETIFICKVNANFEVNNHEIWAVNVIDIIGKKLQDNKSSGGIIYFNRGFHKIGDTLSEIE